MACRDIVVVGASAGGIEALKRLVGSLPADTQAAIFVVLHMRATTSSVLDQILTRASPLPVSKPSDGESIQPGHIYVAVPDRHLLIEKDRIRVLRTARENGYRPAIDILFRSAALTYGPRVIGVILSGMLDDGTAGLIAIKRCGGIAVVQDPSDAEFPDMPASALTYAAPEYVLPIARMGAVVAQLADTPASISEHATADNPGHGPGHPTMFTCPDCNGPLWELKEGELSRFRCWQQHVYSAESLLEFQSDRMEKSVSMAVRALEELAALERRLAEDADRSHKTRMASLLRERAVEKSRHAVAIRDVLLKTQSVPRREQQPEPVPDSTVPRRKPERGKRVSSNRTEA